MAIVFQRESGRPSVFSRWIGAFAAALILFLTVASVSPSLHEACCHHRHAAATILPAGCVIAQFGAGEVLLGELFFALVAPDFVSTEIVHAGGRTAGDEAEPRCLPPNRGPPVLPA